MSDDVLKILLSLAACLVYGFINGFMKKKGKPTASQTKWEEQKMPQVPKVVKKMASKEVERAVAKPKAPKGLSEEVNPFFVPGAIPRKKGRILRGKSKREAFILSEILRTPYI